MKILYKHRTRGQDVESVHILGMSNGFRELGYEVSFCSPPAVKVGAETNAPASKFWNTLALKPPTIIYELMALAYNAISWNRCRRSLKEADFSFVYERYAFFDFSTFLNKRFHNFRLVLEVNGAVNRKDPTHARKIVLKPLAKLMERKQLAAADLITVVSTSLKDSLREIGIPEERILVLPNAVELNRFNPDKSDAYRTLREKYNLVGKKVVGFVGSFTFWHGLDFMVKSLVEDMKRDPAIHLFLVGDGQERGTVEQLVRDNGLSSQVTFTGRIPHSEVPDYIAAIDVGVMPNSNDFGSPMKIFEYMAMKKPVVSARYRPTAEVIDHGRTGFLFEPGDGAEFAKLVCQLLGDEPLRRRVGAEARQEVVANHTWQANCIKVCKALERLCQRQVNRPSRCSAAELAAGKPESADTFRVSRT